jgi:hypothetical protein
MNTDTARLLLDCALWATAALVLLPLVRRRLTRYTERDHRRAYLAHHRAKEEA